MIVKKVPLLRYFFLFGLFGLPLIFWPPAKVPYEIPKVWFFQRWVEILMIVGILSGLGGRKKKKDESADLSFLVIVFLLAAFASSLLGVNFVKSVLGNYYRGDGLITLFHLGAFFFFLTQFWQDSWRKSVVVALCLSNFLVSLWSVFLGIRSGFSGPVGTTFGQPNFLAGYLLVCLPFSFYLIETGKAKEKKIFWSAVFVCQLVAILLTQSIACILGIFLFFVGWWLFKKGKELVFLGISGVLGILGIVFLFSLKKGGFVPGGRERIFVKGIMAFAKRPLFGWGWADFDYAFESVAWPIKFNNDVYVDKAHSNLLEVLVTTGMVGFLAYGAIVLRVIKDLYQRVGREEWDKTLFLVFLLFLFHSQTNVISINEELLFWLILGIV